MILKVFQQYCGKTFKIMESRSDHAPDTDLLPQLPGSLSVVASWHRAIVTPGAYAVPVCDVRQAQA